MINEVNDQSNYSLTVAHPLIDHRRSRLMMAQSISRRTFQLASQDIQNLDSKSQLITGSRQKGYFEQAEWFQKAKVKQRILQFIANVKRNAYILTQDKQYNILQEKYLQAESMNYEEHIVGQQTSGIGLKILQPDDPFMIIYDMLSIILSLLTLWYYPFYVSFYHSIEFDNQYGQVQVYLIAVIIFDILLQCNKATIQFGQIISDRSQIIKYYFKAQGTYDIVLILIWTTFLIQSDIIIQTSLFIMIVSLIIKRTYYKIIVLQEASFQRGTLYHFTALLILMIVIYYFAHITGCLWHYIGSNSCYHTNWLTKYNFNDSSVLIRYNQAFYWSTMTMTTIGYGDITAANPIETAYSSIMMFFSSCIFAYSVNQIGTIIKNINDNSIKFRRSLLIINQYMKKHSVNLKLQGRIRNYLKYYVDQQNNDFKETNSVIQTLPLGLKQELNQDIKFRILSQIPLIAKNFIKKSFKGLAQHLNFISYTPEEEIVSVDEEQNPYLFYVLDGTLSIHEQKTNYKLYDIHKHNTMNQYNFISGNNSKQKIITQTFSNLCKLPRKEFLQVIQLKQADYEKFCELKDELFEHNLASINYKCALCQSESHLLQQCSMIQYRPSIEKLIKSQNFLKNERGDFKRQNQNRRLNSLIEYKKEYNLWLNSLRNDSYTQNEISQQYDQLPSQSKLILQENKHLSFNYLDVNFTNDAQRVPIFETKQLYPYQRNFQDLQIQEGDNNNQMSRIFINNHIKNKRKTFIQKLTNERTTQIKFDENNARIQQNAESLQNFELVQQQQNQLSDMSQVKIPISFDIDQIHIFQYYRIKDNIDQVMNRKSKKLSQQLQNLIKESALYLFSYNLQRQAARCKYIILKGQAEECQ